MPFTIKEIYAKVKANLAYIVIGLLLLTIYNIANDGDIVIVPDTMENQVKPINSDVCIDTTVYKLETDDFFKRDGIVILDLNNYSMSKKRQNSNVVIYRYKQFGNTKRYYTEYRNEPLPTPHTK